MTTLARTAGEGVKQYMELRADVYFDALFADAHSRARESDVA